MAYQAVLQLDAGHPRARERLAEAERRTGEAIVARWLPNQEPALALFDRGGGVVESPTLSLQGAASDDQGVLEGRVPRRRPADRRVRARELAAATRADGAVRARGAARAGHERDRRHGDRLGRAHALRTLPGRKAPALPRDAVLRALGAGWRVYARGPRLGRAAAAPPPRAAPALQPLHRRRARARRRHVLRAREAHRAHAQHAAPQQPDDHGRAPDRQDHVPAPPEARARGRRGRRVDVLPGVRRPAGRARAGVLPRADGGDGRQPRACSQRPAPSCASRRTPRATTPATSATTCSG